MTDYLDDSYDWSDPGLVSAYDELPLWSAPFGLLLLKHVRLERGMQVLDIGCGTGFPLLELAQRLGPSCHVSGIDPWGLALRRARQKMLHYKNRNTAVVQGDGAALPFPDRRFHLVVSNLGLNNFASPERALAECYRVLRAGGRLVLTTNLRGHMRELYEAFASVLRDFARPDWLERLGQHIEHRATVERVRRQFAEAGFTVSRVFYEEFSMRFTDGSAFLRHHFIKAGFLDAWREVVGAQSEREVFSLLEERLNHLVEGDGELALTIPMAYLEGEK
jgi:ubiquinone/menaquinone biosynthesis C-methylase UbiE